MHTGLVSKAHLLQVVLPRPWVILGGSYKHMQECAVETFNLPITLGVAGAGVGLLDLELGTDLSINLDSNCLP